MLPHGGKHTWLILAGRGWGKTRTGAQIINQEARSGRSRRIALVAETAADARDVLVEGDSGIIKSSHPDFRPVYEPSKRKLTWPNGVIAHTYNAVEPDQLRGPQHDFAWCSVGETLVLMGDLSEKRLDEVTVGETVMTRKGPRLVKASTMTGRDREVFLVTLRGGRTILATPNHKIWVENRGFVRIDELQIGDHTCVTDVLIGVEQLGTCMESITRQENSLSENYTRKLQKNVLDQDLQDTMSTTRTKTLQIMIQTTSNTSNMVNIEDTMLLEREDRRSNEELLQSILNESGITDPRSCVNAIVVEQNTLLEHQNHENSAAQNVVISGATVESEVVSVERSPNLRDVYDITVDGEHEFFANGILVHNCDELAKWMYAQETWDMLQFGLRLGQHPRQLVTTTPRPIPVVRELVRDPFTHITRGRTLDNAANLAKTFLAKIIKKYEGTRLGRQELDAEILDDLPGALWTRAMLDKAFIRLEAVPPMEEIVVSLDPSGISDDDDEGDSVGLIVAGKNGDNGYILEDLTCREGPQEWGTRAVNAYKRWGADRIIAEVNYGGAMVEHVIRTIDPRVPVRVVHASRGKFIRAEPVSALYEQGRVRHVGAFPDLEDQMTLLTRSGYQGLGSPDRLDAAVWAITDMFIGDIETNGAVASISGLY